ncbi:sulfite exporter TauE/SafE family protein [Candidatus Neomarinimicrobiota bacterium]
MITEKRISPIIIIWIISIVLVLVYSFSNGVVQFKLNVVLLIGLCFVCELMDSSLGMGYGTTLTPILLATGFEPLQIVPTILVSEFLSGMSASIFHHRAGNVRFAKKSLDIKVAIVLAAGSVLGVIVGVNLAVQIPKFYLKLIIGTIITLAGIVIWIYVNRSFAYKKWKMVSIASVASFNKALSGGGYGPLLTAGQVLSGIPGKASVAITSFAESFTCLVGATLFLLKGQHITLELLIPVCAGALLSVPISANIVRNLNEIILKRSIAIVTIGLGLFTLIRTIF